MSLALLFNKVLTHMIQVLRMVRVHSEQNMEGWASCGAGGSGEKEKGNNAIQDKDGESQPDRRELWELKLASRWS